ncbi:MAG TPA: dTDP-4-dehydrorhamnose reductase [Chthoniobacterales bacterium]
MVRKPRIVVAGSRGRLGAALVRAYARRFDVVPLDRNALDLARPISAQLEGLGFEVLINCAAATNVDWCEGNPALAGRINGTAVEELARCCAGQNARLIHVSTDYVFDGQDAGLLTEQVEPNPVNVYGWSKRAGELAALNNGPDNLVVRVSWVFGPDRPSFLDQIIAKARTEATLAAVADKWSSPTYTRDCAEWLGPRLFDREVRGLLHLCNAGGCTWRDLAEEGLTAARHAGVPLRAESVEPLRLAEMTGFTAQRPVHTVMATQRFQQLSGESPRGWQNAVAEYIARQYRPSP